MSTEVASAAQWRMTAVLREGETVTPLELFFDLVFVLGLTQCTALMAAEPTWEGLAKGMLVLGVLWWSWVGYAWLTSALDPEEDAVRLVIFAAMAALLVVGLCVPHAFDDAALIFALAYAFVRVAHIALFMLASRDDPLFRKAVVGLAMSTAIGVGLLVGASFADGLLQGGLWALALALDMGGPYLFSAEGWKLVPQHFAERHGLIVIIAIGESIVAVGVGAVRRSISESSRRRPSARRSRRRCGGCTSTSSRSLPPGGSRTQSRDAPATRWRATPTPTCTSRWSLGSCSSRSA
jgi:low temperature requirement protein LtrA